MECITLVDLSNHVLVNEVYEDTGVKGKNSRVFTVLWLQKLSQKTIWGSSKWSRVSCLIVSCADIAAQPGYRKYLCPTQNKKKPHVSKVKCS